MAVIVDGLNLNLMSVLQQPILWQATWTSLRIALAAGLLCVMLTMMLLWSSRELYARQAQKAGQTLELTGMLILAMPASYWRRASFYCSTAPSACRKGPTAL